VPFMYLEQDGRATFAATPELPAQSEKNRPTGNSVRTCLRGTILRRDSQ